MDMPDYPWTDEQALNQMDYGLNQKARKAARQYLESRLAGNAPQNDDTSVKTAGPGNYTFHTGREGNRIVLGTTSFAVSEARKLAARIVALCDTVSSETN